MSRRSPTAPISPLDSARIRAGLTVESLAVAAGVHRATVSLWLAGRTRPRHPCYLTRLGSVLGLDVGAVRELIDAALTTTRVSAPTRPIPHT